MDLEWENLVDKGWSKEEILQNGKKKILFKAPIENGIRRIIRRTIDLKKHEEKYVHILFPNSDMAKKRSLLDPPLETGSNEDAISSEVFKHTEIPTKVSKLEREREKLEECANRIYPDDKNTDNDVGDQIEEYVKKSQ